MLASRRELFIRPFRSDGAVKAPGIKSTPVYEEGLVAEPKSGSGIYKGREAFTVDAKTGLAIPAATLLAAKEGSGGIPTGPAKLDRRGFMIVLAASFGAAALLDAGIVSAAQLDPIDVAEKQWWPLIEGKIAEDGVTPLYTLQGIGGSFHKYDIKVTDLYGIPSDVRGQIANWANRFASLYPGRLGFAGHCHGDANRRVRETDPLMEDIEIAIDPASGEPVIFTYLNRLGLGSGAHSGDIMYRPWFDNRPDNIQFFVDRFDEYGEHGGFVINAPEPKNRGEDWFRKVVGISPDGQTFLATNFGFFGVPNQRLKWVPRAWVTRAYYPLTRQEAKDRNIPQPYFDEVGNWTYDVRPGVFRHLYYGEPAPSDPS